MKHTLYWLFSFYLLGAGLLNCGGTEAGNPEDTPRPIVAGPPARELHLNVDVMGYWDDLVVVETPPIIASSALQAPPTDKIKYSVVVEKAKMNVESIQLFSPSSKSPIGNIQGPFWLDLLSSDWFSKALLWNFPMNTRFQKVSVTLAPSEKYPTYAVMLEGNVVPGNRPIQIILTTPFDFNLKSNRSDGLFPLDPNQTNQFFVAFNVAHWLKNTGLQVDEPDVQIPVVITEKNHPELTDIIRQNIRQSCRLFGDPNHDGVLTPDEWSNPNEILARAASLPTRRPSSLYLHPPI